MVEMTEEIYISIDVEADGPIPGEYSMLSLGSVALDQNGKILGNFYRKLKRLPKAKQHPETMKWWNENQETYKEATQSAEEPQQVMNNYYNWLKELDKNNKVPLVALGWPIAFDFMFVSWYLNKFVEELKTISPIKSLIGYNGIDVKTFAWAHLKKSSYKGFILKDKPKNWFKDIPKNEHNALSDALEQGLIFINMLKENQGKK